MRGWRVYFAVESASLRIRLLLYVNRFVDVLCNFVAGIRVQLLCISLAYWQSHVVIRIGHSGATRDDGTFVVPELIYYVRC